MDGSKAGTADLLTNKGSVFDLVAMFIFLLGGDRNFANNLTNTFISYLNNGFTYNDIKNEILSVFYKRIKSFRWNIFSNKKQTSDNLLKQSERYYHKQLKLTNPPTVIERDMDQGTMVSRVSEFYLEPMASYTVQDFIQYFYNTMPIDMQGQGPRRMTGILKYKINEYGIDKLLFMTDLYAEDCKMNNTVFNISKWDEYSHTADELMDEVKSVYPTDKPYYTFKKRNLFNE